MLSNLRISGSEKASLSLVIFLGCWGMEVLGIALGEGVEEGRPCSGSRAPLLSAGVWAVVEREPGPEAWVGEEAWLLRGTRGLGEEGKVSHPMGWPSTPWQSLQAPGPLRDAQGPLIAPLGGEEAGPVQGELQWGRCQEGGSGTGATTSAQGWGPQWPCRRLLTMPGLPDAQLVLLPGPGGWVQVYLKLQPLAPVRRNWAPCPGRAGPQAHSCSRDMATGLSPSCPVPSLTCRPPCRPPLSVLGIGPWGPGLWVQGPEKAVFWGSALPCLGRAQLPNTSIQVKSLNFGFKLQTVIDQGCGTLSPTLNWPATWLKNVSYWIDFFKWKELPGVIK